VLSVAGWRASVLQAPVVGDRMLRANCRIQGVASPPTRRWCLFRLALEGLTRFLAGVASADYRPSQRCDERSAMPTVVRALRLVTILGGIVVGAFILWASLVNAAERQEQHSGAGRSLSERAVERRAVEAVVWGGHAGGQLPADASGKAR
jgi:hypothetical protein